MYDSKLYQKGSFCGVETVPRKEAGHGFLEKEKRSISPTPFFVVLRNWQIARTGAGRLACGFAVG